MNFDVRDFGAAGDGSTKDTVAIQKTIDQCSKHGGTVNVPAGTYLCGTIWLKDNVNLYLDAGAVIQASSELEDYNPDDAFSQNQAFTQENVTGAHLIIALEANNVSISGQGTINGRGEAFFDKSRLNGSNWAIKDKRPGQMIYFCECSNVTVSGISLINSPYWTLFLHGCTDVIIHGLRINNPPKTQNGDGVDIDCCTNVTMSDCIIFSGDDCITLRAHNKTLKNKAMECRNVTISNCVLSTICNAVRVGVGDGTVQDCTISNIVITDSRNGLCIISKYSERAIRGATIDNISFSNIVMDTIMPFYIATGAGGEAPISNIYFENIRAKARKGSYLAGEVAAPLRNISFTNVKVDMYDGKDYVASPEELASMHREWHKSRPAAFFLRNVKDSEFFKIDICWSDVDDVWRHIFMLENVTGAGIKYLSSKTPELPSFAEPVKMDSNCDVKLENCSLSKGNL